MPVVEISVLRVANVEPDKIKKVYVYVRLQGQAMRTSTLTLLGNPPNRTATCNERFRFQYDIPRSRQSADQNKLFVEVWTKSVFSQSCVSVAWTSMEMDHVQGQLTPVDLPGNFEGRRATVTVGVRPLDFGRPVDYPTAAPAVGVARPVDGVPLNPPPIAYGSAGYIPNATNQNVNANANANHGKKQQPWAPAPVKGNNQNNNNNNNYHIDEDAKLPPPNYPSSLNR